MKKKPPQIVGVLLLLVTRKCGHKRLQQLACFECYLLGYTKAVNDRRKPSGPNSRF